MASQSRKTFAAMINAVTNIEGYEGPVADPLNIIELDETEEDFEEELITVQEAMSLCAFYPHPRMPPYSFERADSILSLINENVIKDIEFEYMCFPPIWKDKIPMEIKVMIAEYVSAPKAKTVRAIYDFCGEKWTYRTFHPLNYIPSAVLSSISAVKATARHLEAAPRLNQHETPFPYFDYEGDILAFEQLRCDPLYSRFVDMAFNDLKAALSDAAVARQKLRNLQIDFCPCVHDVSSFLTALDGMTGLRNVTLIGHDHYTVAGIGFNQAQYNSDCDLLENENLLPLNFDFDLEIKIRDTLGMGRWKGTNKGWQGIRYVR